MRGRVWCATLPAMCGAMLLAVAAAASPVSASVSVRADNPVVGGFTKLTFRAPAESSKDATTGLEITIPQRPPVLFVRMRAHPGWKVKTKRKKLDTPQTFDGEKVDSLVTEVILTADKGKGIPPRQFDEFDLTAGPLPDVRALEFPVLQKYEDGREVAWRDPWNDRAQMPPHPVPRVVLAEPGRPAAHHGATADPLARWLGGGGLSLAVLALGVLLLRRRAAPPDRR
jgi:uncharacterized protein YcnI